MKAIICGAGIAGLGAAKFLTDKNWEVVIVEKAHGPRASGYMIDFFGSGYEAAERSGLLPALEVKKGEFENIVFVDEAGKQKAWAHYSTLQATFKGRLFSILRGDMEKVLLDAVSGIVEVQYGVSIENVVNEPSGVRVGLTNGQSVQGDILIGADGIHSHVRELVFGPEDAFLRFLELHTAALIFEDADLVAHLGGQVQMLSVPNRQVGLYPVGENKVAAFFAHRDKRRERVDAVSTLVEVYGDLGWHVPHILEKVEKTDDVYYDWMAQIELAQWHRGRVVLIGDACYAVSLLAGQGASLALGGAYLLTQKIGEGEIDAGLVAFQQQMQPHVQQKQAAGRRTAKWFVPSNGFYEWVRNVSMNLAATKSMSFLAAKFFSTNEKSIFSSEPD